MALAELTPSGAPAPGGAGSELVDVVDAADRVVGRVCRSIMRSHRLRHRAVFIIVRSGAGEVLVHRRSPTKDLWPHRWDIAVGGVVGPGEDYVAAARRELAEEVGIDGVDLVELGGGAYDDADVSLIGRVYLVSHDGPVSFDDGEVVAAEWVPVAGLATRLERDSWVPDSLVLAVPLLAARFSDESWGTATISPT
jgi:8-oxo-dGTP pyrophosphatase MutT (NUDIX family)